MTTPRTGDVWDSRDAYEHYIGRWSRPVAAEFVQWLSVPSGARWLDVGCGSGALTEAIVTLADPASVLGLDPSAAFIERASANLGPGRATFEVGDATAVPLDDATMDAVVSGLVLNFIPDVARALAEFRRVAVPDATIAAYVWDYAGGMELLRRFWDAAVALDPGARALDEGVRFPDTNEAGLRDRFSRAGLADVATRAIEAPTKFVDFDDLWQPFLGGQGPAPTDLAGLSAENRGALRDRLRSDLPVAADGSITLVARAWAVRGRAAPPA